ncbi:MAG: ABC transporter ATP-binding protein [Clostridiales bacterium]|nr:ABC transporter ATP-binding protein [Clostridiales bacterium]
MMGGHMSKDIVKAANPMQAFKNLLPWLKPHSGKIIAAILLALMSTALSVIGPKIMGQATTAIFEGLMKKVQGVGGIDFGRLNEVLMMVLALYAGSSIFQWMQSYLMMNVSLDISYKLSNAISKKIHRMPLDYFEKNAVGDTLSIISNDIDVIGQNLSEVVTQSIAGVASILGIVGMMLSINSLMTLVVVLVVPFSGLLMSVVMKRSRPFFREQQAMMGELNGQVEESYSGQAIIKVFNHEAEVEEVFNVGNEKLYNSAWKSQFFSGLMMPIITFMTNLGYVAVTITGAFLAASGQIAVGDIQAFIAYVRNFTQPIARFAQMVGQIQSLGAASERVFNFLSQAEEKQDEQTVCLVDVKGDVSFEHVRFGYDSAKPVIKDFTSNIKAGQTVALVGKTGAGKTTMIKLLMRFYDVDSGSIKLDGADLRGMTRKDLRTAFGMVLQDTWLFSGTIMENIRYGRLEATDEEVIAAAKAAHADHFITTLPGGYEMELNELADNISQGQRQLLTIARAFLADNRIMIFDEATSNVDTLTEHRIQRAMKKLMKGRTSFVIAHRLSTIREADLILVMEDGDIVEQGNHDQLMELGKVYARLYNSQFELS